MGRWVISAVSFVLWAMPGFGAESLAQLESAVRLAPADLQLGNEYRSASVRAGDPDRAIRFFSELLDENGDSSALRINLALALVDKLSSPETSNIKRGILSNRSIGHLDAALKIDPTSWVAFYSRGMNHLYWPRSRSHPPEAAIRDFEECLALQARDDVESRPHFLFPYVALGDAHAKNDDPGAARDVWRQGLLEFPDEKVLVERLALDDEALVEFVGRERGNGRRISTDLTYLEDAGRNP